ncbi:MAG: response regulator [Pseudomonadota bacterium]|nr:response regulator [Gammaproteobacteria bacterium]MDQ3580905.1 response regulator [Pseudomonadota bacterium]
MQAEAQAAPLRVLLVEDDEDDYRLTRELLAEVPGYRVELDWATSYEAGLSALARRAHDVCLLDYRLGKNTGLDLLHWAAAEGNQTPFILLTGQGAFEVDREAMRAGAADYLQKDRIDAAALERAIRYTLERKRDREALANFNQLLEHRVQERTTELEQANAALRAAMDRSRQAEEGLKESQERLRLAMTTAQMGYHYRDFETGMAIYSDQLGGLCGLPSGSSFANYEQFLNAVHPHDRERVAETVARATREDTDYVHEYRIIRPDGTMRWLADRGRVYRDEHGERLYALGLAWDVTARREAEMEREALYAEERRLREGAEAADRAKDDFLALVSHELRTPLNAIVAWLHILETTPEPDAATLAKATAFLKRSVDQQRRLIADLLDTARITSGKLQLEVRALEPAAVAEAALEVVRSAAEARGVEIYTLIDPKAGPITGDAGRLQQVLWNLLSNAIKFTPRGGRVHLRIERVDPHVRIVVSDTGAGIDPELLPFVFDRFRQSDSSSKRRHGGLGLGLALVHYLVQLHGGSVRAESPGEGRGATFIVELPVRAVRLPAPSVPPAAAGLGGREVEEEAAPGGAQTPSLTGVRLLVVDDQEDAREALATLLARHGAEVSAASSGSEALALLAQGVESAPPHVLVCDIAMPELDGYAVIGQLRALEKEHRIPLSAQIPAIALTAYAQPKDRVRALRAGFQTHLAKPVDPAELIRVIASLVNEDVKLPA